MKSCEMERQDNNLHNQHRTLRTLSTIIFITSLLVTACGPQLVTPSPQNSAILSKPSGAVSVQETVDVDFISAIEGHILNEGGRVQTGEDGRVRLDLSTGTIVRVGPSSLFKLE